MGIYIFTLFLVPLLWIAVNRIKFTVRGKEKLNDREKAYVTCMGVWLFFVSALRNYTVGADTRTYLNIYSRAYTMEWKSVFNWSDIMMIEPGYVISNKLLGFISHNPRFIIIVSSTITISLVSYYIYKNSRIPWLSFFMFVTLGMFGESLCLMRQYISIAIILIAYNAIKDNKMLKFIIMVLLASFIHTSALAILPMFWLSKINWNKLHFCLMLALSAFLFYMIMLSSFRFNENLIAFLAKYTAYDRYFSNLNYGGRGGAIGLVLIFFAFLFLLILKLYINTEKLKKIYITFGMASALLTIFSFILSISERLLPYFSLMFLFSVPEAIMEEQRYRIRIQYIAVICAVLIFYYVCIVSRADSMSIIPYELWNYTL